MHTLSQMDPKLYLEVLRKRAEVWDELITALFAPWYQWLKPRWTPETRISVDEVLADLAYGRD